MHARSTAIVQLLVLSSAIAALVLEPRCAPHAPRIAVSPLAPYAPRTPQIAMRDGKQRRKKQSELPPPPPPPPPAPEPAGRVTGAIRDHHLSVRKQISLVKAYKAAAAAPPRRVERTSFRRAQKATRNATEAEEKVTVDVSWDPTQLPVLYIDGYNIIGQWPRLKKRRDKDDMDGARRLLLEDVSQFSLGRFEAYVVYDASGWSAGGGTSALGGGGGGGVGGLNSPDRHEVELGTTIAWAHDSADAYIERETKRLGDASKRQVWVATNDGPVRTASAAHGATVVSSQWLIKELKASRAESSALLQSHNDREVARARVTRDAWQEELGELFGGREEELNRASNKLSRRDREALDALEAEAQRGAAAPPKGAMARAQQLAEQRRLGNRVRAPPRRRPASDSESSGPGSLEP